MEANFTCTDGVVVCIHGSPAVCNVNSYSVFACPGGTSCYAMPATSSGGLQIQCVSRQAAISAGVLHLPLSSMTAKETRASFLYETVPLQVSRSTKTVFTTFYTTVEVTSTQSILLSANIITSTLDIDGSSTPARTPALSSETTVVVSNDGLRIMPPTSTDLPSAGARTTSAPAFDTSLLTLFSNGVFQVTPQSTF